MNTIPHTSTKHLAEYNPKFSRSCNVVAFCPVEPKLLVSGLDKVRNDYCLLIWDTEIATKSIVTSEKITPLIQDTGLNPIENQIEKDFNNGLNAKTFNTPNITHQTTIHDSDGNYFLLYNLEFSFYIFPLFL